MIHQFPFIRTVKEFTVKIIQLDEICENKQEIVVTKKEPLSIYLDPRKFCSDDTSKYEIIINGSSKGNFTGTGIDAITKNDSKYFLEPVKLLKACRWKFVYI